MSVIFLSVDDVIRIQERVIARDGGLAGTLDMGLLTAAVMMPQQSFSGEYLHPDLASMAAAYLYHLAKNHPFLDGNKRVALATAITFLIANGASKLPDQSEAADITLAVAASQMTKDQLISWFQGIVGAGFPTIGESGTN